MENQNFLSAVIDNNHTPEQFTKFIIVVLVGAIAIGAALLHFLG
jgi:hypothetical protein